MRLLQKKNGEVHSPHTLSATRVTYVVNRLQNNSVIPTFVRTFIDEWSDLQVDKLSFVSFFYME